MDGESLVNALGETGRLDWESRRGHGVTCRPAAIRQVTATRIDRAVGRARLPVCLFSTGRSARLTSWTLLAKPQGIQVRVAHHYAEADGPVGKGTHVRLVTPSYDSFERVAEDLVAVGD